MAADDLKVRILGCSDAFSTGGNYQTSFLVKTQHLHFLIDCGATILTSIQKYKVDAEAIRYIFITHFHGDHYGGLPYFLMYAKLHQKRKTPLCIYGPAGIKHRTLQLMEMLYQGSTEGDWGFDLAFKEYTSNTPVFFEGYTLTPFPVKHSAQALPHGFRFEIGTKVLAYSGDTTWVDELIALSHQADLFICECNFYDTQTEVHLDYKTLKHKWPGLTAQRLLLTHLGTEMLSRLASLDFECATDGLELSL